MQAIYQSAWQKASSASHACSQAALRNKTPGERFGLASNNRSGIRPAGTKTAAAALRSIPSQEFEAAVRENSFLFAPEADHEIHDRLRQVTLFFKMVDVLHDIEH